RARTSGGQDPPRRFLSARGRCSAKRGGGRAVGTSRGRTRIRACTKSTGLYVRAWARRYHRPRRGGALVPFSRRTGRTERAVPARFSVRQRPWRGARRNRSRGGV